MKTIFTRRAKRTDSTNGPLTRREVIGAPPPQAQRAANGTRPSEGDVTTTAQRCRW